MARLPRLFAPSLAQLITAQFTQATTNVLTIIPAPAFALLAGWLGQSAHQHQVSIQGWCIASKGLYLLATPSDSLGVSRMIQDLGRRLAAHLKCGAVFSGRYRSTIPQPEQWVLPCLIWLERSATREGLVDEPTQWFWSSAQAHTEGSGLRASWLQPHLDYWLCGNTPFARQATYRQQLSEGNDAVVERKIEAALRGQWGLGDQSFLVELSVFANRRVQPGLRGRPMKSVTKSPTARRTPDDPEHN
jgi:putative transposase